MSSVWLARLGTVLGILAALAAGLLLAPLAGLSGWPG